MGKDIGATYMEKPRSVAAPPTPPVEKPRSLAAPLAKAPMEKPRSLAALSQEAPMEKPNNLAAPLADKPMSVESVSLLASRSPNGSLPPAQRTPVVPRATEAAEADLRISKSPAA